MVQRGRIVDDRHGWTSATSLFPASPSLSCSEPILADCISIFIFLASLSMVGPENQGAAGILSHVFYNGLECQQEKMLAFYLTCL